jgi:hypothetical protein
MKNLYKLSIILFFGITSMLSCTDIMNDKLIRVKNKIYLYKQAGTSEFSIVYNEKNNGYLQLLIDEKILTIYFNEKILLVEQDYLNLQNTESLHYYKLINIDAVNKKPDIIKVSKSEFLLLKTHCSKIEIPSTKNKKLN